MTTKLPESKLTFHQKKPVNVVRFSDESGNYELVAEVRHDDSCRNGHNTFAITADLWKLNKQGRRVGQEPVACGCLHDEIAKHMPDLAPLIKWHLCSTDGPLHYLTNTIYQASDRDYKGFRKGEVGRIETKIAFGNNPIMHAPGSNWVRNKFVAWLKEHGPRCGFDFEIIALHHKKEEGDRTTYSPKYTFGGFDAKAWHECPFDDDDEAMRFLAALQTCDPKFIETPVSWGEGKEPDLEAAQSCAIWPDATLEQLQDRSALESRLPALMEAFKSDVESLGFVY